MAKRPSRYEADDSTTPATAAKGSPRPRGRRVQAPGAPQADIGARADEPGSTFEERSGRTVQQAPGDAQPRGDLALQGDDPTEAEIRERAYQMYLERGEYHGRDFDDWVEAEQQLRKTRKSK